jgi:hypothetical protein
MDRVATLILNLQDIDSGAVELITEYNLEVENSQYVYFDNIGTVLRELPRILREYDKTGDLTCLDNKDKRFQF